MELSDDEIAVLVSLDQNGPEKPRYLLMTTDEGADELKPALLRLTALGLVNCDDGIYSLSDSGAEVLERTVIED